MYGGARRATRRSSLGAGGGMAGGLLLRRWLLDEEAVPREAWDRIFIEGGCFNDIGRYATQRLIRRGPCSGRPCPARGRRASAPAL